MKHTKSMVVPALSFAILAGASAVSNALSFTVFVNNVNPLTLDASGINYAQPPGVSTVSGPVYRSLFIPDTLGSGHSYSTPSVVRFGQVQTLGPAVFTPNTSSTFNSSKVAFDFALQNDLPSGSAPVIPFDQFLVEGNLTGNMGNDNLATPFSTASYAINVFKDLTQPANVASLTTDPINGIAAYKISTTIGGRGYDVFIDNTVSLPAQGTQPLTISGYIRTSDVPEPGSLAMLVGMSVSGGLMVRRMRRRA